MIQVKNEDNGYDDSVYLSLRGRGDLGDGQTLKLSLGETIVCGRSRHCEWSLKRAPGYLKTEKKARRAIQESLTFRSVSRRHVRIAFLAKDQVELENLSTNGTLLDGHRIDRIVLDDCLDKAHTIQLGPRGVTLELEPGSLPV